MTWRATLRKYLGARLSPEQRERVVAWLYGACWTPEILEQRYAEAAAMGLSPQDLEAHLDESLHSCTPSESDRFRLYRALAGCSGSNIADIDYGAFVELAEVVEGVHAPQNIGVHALRCLEHLCGSKLNDGTPGRYARRWRSDDGVLPGDKGRADIYTTIAGMMTCNARPSLDDHVGRIRDAFETRLRMADEAIAGRWDREESPIGEGSTGRVYPAVDRYTGARVALKFFHPHVVDNEPAFARITSVYRALAEHSIPGVVQVQFAGGRHGSERFVVLDLVPNAIPISAAAATINDKLALVADAARILDAFHTRLDAHHGDLGVENLLVQDVDGGRDVWITDFDLVTTGASAEIRGPRRSVIPRWAPPEVQLGLESKGIKTDVYALGCTALEVVAGPFALQQIDAKLASVSQPEIREVLRRALGSIESRYDSAGELARALDLAIVAAGGCTNDEDLAKDLIRELRRRQRSMREDRMLVELMVRHRSRHLTIASSIVAHYAARARVADINAREERKLADVARLAFVNHDCPENSEGIAEVCDGCAQERIQRFHERRAHRYSGAARSLEGFAEGLERVLATASVHSVIGT